MHARRWRLYAHVHTGDRKAAEEITEAVFEQLRLRWAYVLRQPSAESCAWSLFKQHVADWLAARGRDSALAAAAFGCVTRPLPRACRQRFELLENRMALYAAITRLPERQCDALVLTYVIGYKSGQVADLLGVDEAAVRSHAGCSRRELPWWISSLL
ncbi:RNA polymerase sigma factor [Streptomyces sp. UNOC14_S4]|nr:RNA polymerase sigma factor [Streptomyces sp. UNOC14_S4]